MRKLGVCVNCLERDEIVAFGLCRTCYQSEWREKREVRPDRYSKAEKRRARKARKTINTLTDCFEDCEELGLLESLETREIIRDLMQQLIGRMRRVVGESYLDRLEATLEVAPPGVKEYEERDDEDEDEDDDDDGGAAA